MSPEEFLWWLKGIVDVEKLNETTISDIKITLEETILLAKKQKEYNKPTITWGYPSYTGLSVSGTYNPPFQLTMPHTT